MTVVFVMTGVNRSLLALLLGAAVSGSWPAPARADLPVVVAPSEPDPSWEMNTSLWGRRDAFQYPQVQANQTQEGLIMNGTRFLTPLRDDGAPYSLRPFLQRTSSILLSADIGHSSMPNPYGGPDRTATWENVDGAVDIYVKRWLALAASLDYEHDALHDVGVDQGTHTLAAAVGVGFRVRDLRATLAYGAESYHQSGTWASPRTALGLSLFGVIARQLTVGLSGGTVPSGGDGTLSVEYFPSPELGIFGGAEAARGHLYQGSVMATRYVASAGIAGWVDPSAGLVVRYSRTIEHVPPQVIDGQTYGDDQTSNRISLEVHVRFP
jgi:hypothetical protein